MFKTFKTLVLPVWLAVAFFFATPVTFFADEGTPLTVVELFTSQGGIVRVKRLEPVR